MRIFTVFKKALCEHQEKQRKIKNGKSISWTVNASHSISVYFSFILLYVRSFTYFFYLDSGTSFLFRLHFSAFHFSIKPQAQWTKSGNGKKIANKKYQTIEWANRYKHNWNSRAIFCCPSQFMSLHLCSGFFLSIFFYHVTL